MSMLRYLIALAILILGFHTLVYAQSDGQVLASLSVDGISHPYEIIAVRPEQLGANERDDYNDFMKKAFKAGLQMVPEQLLRAVADKLTKQDMQGTGYMFVATQPVTISPNDLAIYVPMLWEMGLENEKVYSVGYEPVGLLLHDERVDGPYWELDNSDAQILKKVWLFIRPAPTP